LAGAALIVTLLAGTLLAAETMSVQVREGRLRARPSFFGSIVATLPYGHKVAVLDEQNGWTRISTKGKTGWMHVSALSEKEIELRAGRRVSSQASSDEVALAGKGFSREVEEEYRKKNRKIDYKWVDRMERIEYSPRELQKFLAQGRVRGGGR
jgi:uncharacterized protein YgiM (DUF1202 family)